MTFGLFEANLKTGERWKAGHRVKLQRQLFKALTVLRENAGEAVSREDLQLRVWGPDVAVDFGHSLGSAIKKVGEALGDSADNPHLIETPPAVDIGGYRGGGVTVDGRASYAPKSSGSLFLAATARRPWGPKEARKFRSPGEIVFGGKFSYLFEFMILIG